MEKKKVCILLGSPRKNGNTAAMTSCFSDELEKVGCAIEKFSLYELKIFPCLACRCCQKDWTIFGCPQEDDMQMIFDAVHTCDLLVLASPIYSWYCTPPMKSVLDRLVYGMNKYYGEKKGPSLWAGKHVALITTCGYRPEKGADLWEAGITRYCKHSQLKYDGMLVERHLGYDVIFMDEEKELHTRAFARELARKIS